MKSWLVEVHQVRKWESGLKAWSPFCKFVIEWGVVIVEYKKAVIEKSQAKVPKKTVVEHLQRRNSEADFVPDPKRSKKETLPKVILPNMKSVRAKKARNHEEGADDQLHMALAMSISKQEQERMWRERVEKESMAKVDETKKSQKEKQQIRNVLEAFKASDKESYAKGPQLTAYHRLIVHMTSGELGLVAKSIGEGDKRRITVYKPVLDLSQYQDDEVEISVSNVII